MLEGLNALGSLATEKPTASPWSNLSESLCTASEAVLQSRAADSGVAEGKKVHSPFWYNKHVTDCKRNWDLFYKRNGTRFFKDRHWIVREFSAMLDKMDTASGREEECTFLEVGCGVGNLIFPLCDALQLSERKNCRIYGCDFSPRAIDLLRSDPRYDASYMHAFIADITAEGCLSSASVGRDNVNLGDGSIDMLSAIFVLSAIPPDRQQCAINAMLRALKPGGLIFFRDYAKYDGAQLRFKIDAKMDEDFYVRQDGTLSFFFTKEYLERMFCSAELNGNYTCVIEQSNYMVSKQENKKKDYSIQRIFLQTQIRKIC